VADEFQTIHRTSDPIEAEILADLLCQNGIDARVIGTRHGALIGVAQHILQLRVEVPAHQVKDGCEIVDAYVAEHRADPSEQGAAQAEDEDDEDEDDEVAHRARLRPLLAAGITPIVPGGGHFYARRPAAAFVVILGYLGALSTLVTAPDRDREMTAMLLFAGMLLFDLVGSQAAVRSFNRGVRASTKRQLAVALSVLAAVAAGSRLVAPYIPDLPSRQMPMPFDLAEEPPPFDPFAVPLQPAN
jgi:hypothetical protein